MGVKVNNEEENNIDTVSQEDITDLLDDHADDIAADEENEAFLSGYSDDEVDDFEMPSVDSPGVISEKEPEPEIKPIEPVVPAPAEPVALALAPVPEASLDLAEIGKISERMRKQEGKLGTLNSTIITLQKQLTEAKAAPAEVIASPKSGTPPVINNSESMRMLKEELPELANAFTEFEDRMRTEFGGKPDIDINSLVDEKLSAANEVRVQENLVSAKYSNWQTLVGTSHFAGWLQLQDAAIKSQSQSDKSTDVISVLDNYEQFVNNEKVQVQKLQDQQKRINKNIPATTRSSANVEDNTDQTGEDAFEQGFKNMN